MRGVGKVVPRWPKRPAPPYTRHAWNYSTYSPIQLCHATLRGWPTDATQVGGGWSIYIYIYIYIYIHTHVPPNKRKSRQERKHFFLGYSLFCLLNSLSKRRHEHILICSSRSPRAHAAIDSSSEQVSRSAVGLPILNMDSLSK